jgi:phosphoglycolate phosphatase-like HAD superfamily hydrolase
LIKAVILDLDGTLIHLPIDYEELFLEFKKIMQVDNVHPLVDAISRLDKNTRGKVFRVWDKAEFAASVKMTVNEEGMKIYEKFAQKPKALVTIQGKTIVKIILGQLGLSFDVIVTREDSLNRTEQLKNAAEKLKTQFQSILFVGNIKNDSLAAEKVGCQFLRIK